MTVVVSVMLGFAPTASAVVTANVSGNTLTVNGDGAANLIKVTLPGGDGITPNPGTGVPDPPPDPATTPYIVDVAAPDTITATGGCTLVNPQQASCSRGGLQFGAGFAVRINGAAGSDWIQTIMPTQALGDLSLLQGGAGNDALFGSENEEVVMGDAGDDLIDAGAGGDYVSGGTIIETSPGIVSPSFDGGVNQPANYGTGIGAGKDRLYGGGFDDQMTDGDVDTGTASTTNTALFNNDLVDGGVCVNEPLPAGVPIPTGLGTTCPLLAANVDNPEDHDAIMLAHRTKALVIDVLILTATQGGPGENEQIRRIEAIWGGAGNDLLYGRDGDFGDDSLRGNGGNDRLEARGGDDELLGGDGQDHLIGGPGADVMNPGSHIIQQTATATTTTADGPDIVDGGTNSTIVGGHSQSDLVTYEGRGEPMRIDLSAPNTIGAPGENDRLIGVEDVMGGHRDDVIIGDAVSNLISGDPQPPIINVPPDPPLPPGPPGGHFGNDHITSRGDAVADTVDCTEGVADIHIADALDGSINCETLDRPACGDSKDNDGDGKSDFPADPGCTSKEDMDEFNPIPACSDGIDNDKDGKVDLKDIGCENPSDNDETDPATTPACSDKKDNDHDGKIDYPADKGCEGAGDKDETDGPRCDPNVAYRCFGIPKIGGPNPAGRVTVAKDGSFRLTKNIITCPTEGGACAVRNAVTASLTTKAAKKVSASAKKKKAKRKTVRIGTGTYTIKNKAKASTAGTRGTVRAKLSRKALRLLKQYRALRVTVQVRVGYEGTNTGRDIRVILKAPKKPKKSRKG